MSVLTIRIEHITKDYPGTRALDDVSVAYEGGQVHALVGKNGSGKSTLVKILAGAVLPTGGSIYLNDELLDLKSTADAHEKGICTVYQEMSLVPGLTIAENIFLGRLPKKNHIIDWSSVFEKARALLARMKVDFDPQIPVSRLSMWQMQVVEITKALSFDPKVIMLDEPTSALAKNEVANLFEAIRALKEEGVIVIYVSHKLHELPLIADTVTVLRDGKLIGTRPMAELRQSDIVHMMFGEVTVKERPEDLQKHDEIIMQVKGLSRKGKYEDINFSLYRGEILGIAGMLGSGRTELLRGIFGADPFDSGEVVINGVVHHSTNPVTMVKAGIGLTPEDRKLEGLILIQSVRDNLCYASMHISADGWIENKKKREKLARKQVEDLDIIISSLDARCESLSGGNQQKVVVGNWLNISPRIMLYDEPSRGIDVNAKMQIFEIIWDQARKGVSSIFVSSELEELMEVCHRILIMREGKIVDEVFPDEMNVSGLYELSMGA